MYICRCLITLVPFLAIAETLTPVWVETGASGQVLARTVVATAADCPSISIDGGAGVPMPARMPVPAQFRPVCEFSIPASAKRASVAGQALVLPVADPARVVVIGDTGCRLKGERLQACNDPAEWPFAKVAEAAAASKPQLVIHVGDYVYRETPCPADERAQCGGSPSGDSWATWNADFFGPAKALLKAAPWAFSRGNHESCARSWIGWFYYLDPRPFPETCPMYSDPYLITLGGFQLLMVDTSQANDAKVEPKQLALYTAQLKSYETTYAWLVEHHPLWALKRDKAEGANSSLTEVMSQSYEAAGLRNISLVLAGHTHLFEILSFASTRPPQIVAGDAGTSLASKIQKDLRGETVFGTAVQAGASRHEFGFTLLQHRGVRWDLRLNDQSGKALASCTIRGRVVDCGGSKQ
jgi:predicted phosphodiesterase